MPAEESRIDTVGSVMCSVDKCARRASARGWCFTHYRRWKRHGDPTVVAVTPPRDVHACSVDGCANEAAARTWCSMHYARFLRHGDPTRIAVRHNWSGDNPTYRALHKRIERAQGKAAALNCVDCGGPALDWSYEHGEPDEMRADLGWPYSPNLAAYAPRCRTCHKRLDDPRPVGLRFRWANR